MAAMAPDSENCRASSMAPLKAMAERTKSDPTVDPSYTGAELAAANRKKTSEFRQVKSVCRVLDLSPRRGLFFVTTSRD